MDPCYFNKYNSWLWFFILAIILFIILIVIIETNVEFTSITTINSWVWLLFIFAFILLFISFCFYYSTPVCKVVEPVVIVASCPCNIVEEKCNKNDILNNDTIPLSSLNPFL